MRPAGAGGFNEGRAYFFELPSKISQDWINSIRTASRTLKQAKARQLTPFDRMRVRVRKFYHAKVVSGFFMLLIALNFVTGILESEVRPAKDSALKTTLEILDYSFVSIFSVELALNVFVNWKDDFVNDSWNWFDAFIVFGTIQIALAQRGRSCFASAYLCKRLRRKKCLYLP
jgi:hypothetical protein